MNPKENPVGQENIPMVSITAEVPINPFESGIEADDILRIIQSAQTLIRPYAGYRWSVEQFAKMPLLGYFNGSHDPAKALDIIERHGDYVMNSLARTDGGLVNILEETRGEINEYELMRLCALNTMNMRYYQRFRALHPKSNEFRKTMDNRICSVSRGRFKGGSDSFVEEVSYPEVSGITDPRYSFEKLKALVDQRERPEARLQVSLFNLGGHPLTRAVVSDIVKEDPQYAIEYNQLLKKYKNLFTNQYATEWPY